MPLVPFQLFQSLHCCGTPTHEVVGSDVPEIARGQSRVQPQPDIGWRRPARHFYIESQLRIVGWKPMGLGPDEIVKIAPGPPGYISKIGGLTATDGMDPTRLLRARQPSLKP